MTICEEVRREYGGVFESKLKSCHCGKHFGNLAYTKQQWPLLNEKVQV